MKPPNALSETLWKIYNRPEKPTPWETDGNLPWDDPAFSERMLREHLDESHGAASRVEKERAAQIEWLWEKLRLSADARLFDVTCGPGLYAVEFALRGCAVVGVDFSPAAIAYARDLARAEGVSARCEFLQQDVRAMHDIGGGFDGAILLYGQLAVMTRAEAQSVLAQIAAALKPGARLAVELLNPDRVDKTDSTWWFTDDSGLWGDAPFLHLGERFWLADENLSVERYQIVHLETGEMDEIQLCDRVYSPAEMTAVMRAAGFSTVDIIPAWGGLPLYDADEWLVYLAER